jgi:hypothetical protein
MKNEVRAPKENQPQGNVNKVGHTADATTDSAAKA